MIRTLTSGRLTLILIASLSGMYLQLSFKYDEPLHAFLNLAGTEPLYALPVVLFSIHILLKGLRRFSSSRFNALPSTIMLLSLSVLIGGVYLSHILRDETVYRMAASESTGDGQVLVDIRMDIPDEIAVVGEASGILVRGVEATINDRGRRLAIRTFPFTMTSSGYAYINDANISPTLEVISDSGVFVLPKIRMLPPGRERTIPLNDGYSLTIRLAGYRRDGGRDIGPIHYRLNSPSYAVRVTRGGEVILDGLLSDNQTLEGNSLLLKAGRTRKWIEVVFVRDAMVPLLYPSIALFLIGLILYPLELYKTFKL